MPIDLGALINTLIDKILIPELAEIAAKQHAAGTLVTEASIKAEAEQRGLRQRAKDEAWLLANPLPPSEDPAA